MWQTLLCVTFQMAEAFAGGARRRQCNRNSCKHLGHTSPPWPPAPSHQSPLLQSYDIMFCLFLSLIVQVSNIRAFLLRIVRREEKAKKNFKGTRMRKLTYPEKTSFHFCYEITYVYVSLIYVCIHIPTYIQVGIMELLWRLNKIWYMKRSAQYPTPKELSMHLPTVTIIGLYLEHLAQRFIYCQSSITTDDWMITPPHTVPMHNRRLRFQAVM